MRTTLCMTMAIGILAVVGVVPVSLAQDAQVADHGKFAGTGVAVEEPQSHQRLGTSSTGVFVAEPSGKVWVAPESLEGEPSYARRTTVGQGITVVEVSTTPFMPVLTGSGGLSVNPAELPAPW